LFSIQDGALTWDRLLLRIVSATVIGTVVGVECEYKNRPAGMYPCIGLLGRVHHRAD
jgi:uncharacterized membrane protein YhiD involved in acid resistance